jgi:hypothetical protein
MFSMHCGHLHALFVVFHYFSPFNILSKNQIKKYIILMHLCSFLFLNNVFYRIDVNDVFF